LLARLLADLDAVPELDLSLSGFGEDELKTLLQSLNRREKREQPETFDVDAALDAAHARPVAKRGQLWRLGDHRLLCGDATNEGDVTRLLDGRTADLCLVDPPYGVNLGSHGGQARGARKRAIANDALSPELWRTFCAGWAKLILTHTNGACYVFMSTKEWPTVSAVLAEAGGHWSDSIIWRKDRFVLGRADYQRAFEPIWYGWREGSTHHWCGDRDQDDVWTIDRPARSPLHPTTKPLELMERAIENSSRPGNVVLDVFLGSGSTLIAAERTGRVCYGMELDEGYCDVIVARWQAFTCEQAVLVAAPDGAAP
jgi:DNA modification methylase